MVLTEIEMAAMSELIEWMRPADALPDSDMTVLVIEGGEVDAWPGFLDGEQWRTADGFPIANVLFWAHMPQGPEASHVTEC